MRDDSDSVPDGTGGRRPGEAVLDPATVETPEDAVGGASGDTVAITFKLYATLQDRLPAGAVKNAVGIEVPSGASLNDVIDRYQVPRELAHLVLLNGVFVCDADRDEPGRFSAGDVLAIWPPVAGG